MQVLDSNLQPVDFQRNPNVNQSESSSEGFENSDLESIGDDLQHSESYEYDTESQSDEQSGIVDIESGDGSDNMLDTEYESEYESDADIESQVDSNEFLDTNCHLRWQFLQFSAFYRTKGKCQQLNICMSNSLAIILSISMK